MVQPDFHRKEHRTHLGEHAVNDMKNNAIYKSQSGFTYIGALFIVFLISLNLTLASVLYSFSLQREKEQQLIFIGNQFKQAIENYYFKSPGVVKRYPQNFNDLLADNRFVNTQRHLRRIYKDPMTSKADWGIVKAYDGGIMGVYSLSEQKVLKTSNFSEENIALESKTFYSDWKFTFEPVAAQPQNAIDHIPSTQK